MDNSKNNSRYEVFNEYNKKWLEFIPMKAENDKGIQINDLTYNKLPSFIWGRILVGNVSQNMYIYKTFSKKELRMKY